MVVKAGAVILYSVNVLFPDTFKVFRALKIKLRLDDWFPVTTFKVVY